MKALDSAAILLGPSLVRALGATWRIRYVGGPRVRAARGAGGPVMYAHMHGLLLPLTYSHRNRGIQVMVSESRDGELIARVLEAFGFGTVRGSTTRGGERALVRLIQRAGEGRDIGITPDGPKGPRGSAQPGAVLIAARAGVPVVPLGAAADRAWRARSWDRFLVPKPWSKVWIVSGEAVRFGRDDLVAPDAACERLARAIAEVETEAEAYASQARVPAETSRGPE